MDTTPAPLRHRGDKAVTNFPRTNYYATGMDHIVSLPEAQVCCAVLWCDVI